jgi:predicted TPR repeat methyltransferase
VRQAIDGLRLDVAADRLAGDRVDLVVATNIFPYLDDVELTLALANIAAILAPGGILLHNEARPLVGELTSELDLPLTHSRTAVLATVRGSATPLYDRVFIHVNRRAAKEP